MRKSTRKYAVALALAAVALAVPVARTSAKSALSGDVVRVWSGHALEAVRATNASDTQAARLYAMVNVAMFDAVNGLEPRGHQREEALVAPQPGSSGDQLAAAAGAAHDILVSFDPAGASRYDAQLAADLGTVRSTGQADHGREWGGRVAAAVLEARSDDGSTPVESQPAGTGPGAFRASWSGVQFRNLEPFAVEDTDRYLGDGPPALSSAAYAADFNEVKVVGDAARPDQAALDTFRFWSLGGRTSQPPGAWVQVAQIVSADRELTLTDTARLFALQTMAMADTVAPTIGTKVTHHFWRPQTAINEADTDGNDDTVASASWRPRAGSPGTSPEHWSGHSSFSAAGATVLAKFFCTDAISFRFASDSSNGAARTYPGFSAAAEEAGLSRVLGGIHFPFSNEAGLVAGRAVANDVIAGSLLPSNDHVGAEPCAV